jgi:hypothetical protein
MRAMRRRINSSLKCLSIAVLRTLNQKDHQKCVDCGTRVNYKLPSVTKVKERTRNCPSQHNEDR